MKNEMSSLTAGHADTVTQSAEAPRLSVSADDTFNPLRGREGVGDARRLEFAVAPQGNPSPTIPEVLMKFDASPPAEASPGMPSYDPTCDSIVVLLQTRACSQQSRRCLTPALVWLMSEHLSSPRTRSRLAFTFIFST
eukprot:TRINITY_DN43182_c0_g1_i1.p2 TRINITY_DN43182_c0_g1~~TRINITY_DN43182_c0_g1_i1.p2  ORF type:complete len:138 (+),score=0.41 TRINITY_DN43182_c0_g1_i1:503-916(+)